MSRPYRLGLIVNPIAGMGGRVGLKGTDGTDTVARARGLGAVPLSGERAATALAVVARALGDRVELVTPPGEMGESVARAAGFAPAVVGTITPGATTAADTARAVRAIEQRAVDLLLFAGGDGTARDVCRALAAELPVLGIPTGVKMHSAVYATTPRAAGEVAVRFLNEEATRERLAHCREAEVMDIDEEAVRAGRVSARLYGYLRVPVAPSLVQRVKAGRGGGEAGELAAIAAEVVDRMADGRLYLLGPGTTTRAIADRLGIAKTLLGVDLVYRGELVARDVSEREILAHLSPELATPRSRATAGGALWAAAGG